MVLFQKLYKRNQLSSINIRSGHYNNNLVFTYMKRPKHYACCLGAKIIRIVRLTYSYVWMVMSWYLNVLKISATLPLRCLLTVAGKRRIAATLHPAPRRPLVLRSVTKRPPYTTERITDRSNTLRHQNIFPNYRFNLVVKLF